MIYHACVPSVMLKTMQSSKKAPYTLQHLNFTVIKERELTNRKDGNEKVKQIKKLIYLVHKMVALATTFRG